MTDLAAPPIRHLADAARRFSRHTPRLNPTGSYARALAQLVDAARVFAVKDDAEWAAEVIAAREGRGQP